jgi:hypothetical protein
MSENVKSESGDVPTKLSDTLGAKTSPELALAPEPEPELALAPVPVKRVLELHLVQTNGTWAIRITENGELFTLRAVGRASRALRHEYFTYQRAKNQKSRKFGPVTQVPGPESVAKLNQKES